MAELPDDVYENVSRLCEEGDEFADGEDYAAAVGRYEEAWDFLPEPKADSSAALWILGAPGDAHFLAGDYKAGREVLMRAVNACADAAGNPFIRLRLGQCLFELGEQREAANWLAGAYVMEGNKLFEDDDPKYLAFVKPQLKPPPGGWPKGR